MLKKLFLAVSMYVVFCTDVTFCAQISIPYLCNKVWQSIPEKERSDQNAFPKYLMRCIAGHIGLESTLHASHPSFLLERITMWKAPLERHRNNPAVKKYLFELYDEIARLKIQAELSDKKQKQGSKTISRNSSRSSLISFASSLFKR